MDAKVRVGSELSRLKDGTIKNVVFFKSLGDVDAYKPDEECYLVRDADYGKKSAPALNDPWDEFCGAQEVAQEAMHRLGRAAARLRAEKHVETVGVSKEPPLPGLDAESAAAQGEAAFGTGDANDCGCDMWEEGCTATDPQTGEAEG